MHKIAVIIPSYNRKTYLNDLIQKIKSQQNVKPYSIEIVVIVDGSTDGTYEMLKDNYPDIHVIKGTGQWWFTKSLNEGCKFALRLNPQFILTLNDDVVIGDDYIYSLLNAISKLNENCIIGSMSLTNRLPHKVTFSGIKRISRYTLKSHSYLPMYYSGDNELTGIYPSFSLVTRGMLIPAKFLEELGFFDEMFVQYGSDEDFCMRAVEKGIKTYVCWDAKIFENEELSGKGSPVIQQSFIQFLKNIFNRYSKISITKNIKFYLRHGRPVFLPFYLVFWFLGTLKSYFKYRYGFSENILQ